MTSPITGINNADPKYGPFALAKAEFGGFKMPQITGTPGVEQVRQPQELEGKQYAGYQAKKWGNDLGGLASRSGGLGEKDAIYERNGARLGARLYTDMESGMTLYAEKYMKQGLC